MCCGLPLSSDATRGAILRSRACQRASRRCVRRAKPGKSGFTCRKSMGAKGQRLPWERGNPPHCPGRRERAPGCALLEPLLPQKQEHILELLTEPGEGHLPSSGSLSSTWFPVRRIKKSVSWGYLQPWGRPTHHPAGYSVVKAAPHSTSVSGRREYLLG